MQVREEIELSGRDNPDNTIARWEFNRSVLFERTNSMAETCGELASMIETLDSYYQFLGPELRAVTGDPQARLFSRMLATPAFQLCRSFDFSPASVQHGYVMPTFD